MTTAIAVVMSAAIASASAGKSASGNQSEQARSAAESRIARSNLGGGIEAALGNAFAGIWFDPSTARVHVGVTSTGSRQLVEAVSARAGVTDLVTETPVASTWIELEAAQKTLDAGLKDLFARGEVRTSLDPERNAVEVELGSTVPASRRSALRWDAATSGVDVLISVAPRPLLVHAAQARCQKFEKNKANCDKPIVAGVRIEGENGLICTAGPPALLQDHSTAEKATATYLLTAGHCIKESGGAKWYAFTKEKAEKKLIGEAEQGLRGEKGAAGDLIDAGFIKIDNPGNWVHEGANAATPVTPGIAPWDPTKEVEPFAITAQGPTEPMKGTEVCISGQTSGTTCAKVFKMSVTETFENKAKEKWTAEKTVEVEEAKTEAGDSGGPWFLKAEPGKVLGTHIGAGGGFANFQPLAVSFENFETNMQLLTTANEKRVHPGPITGEAGETLPKGTEVTAESTNTITQTSVGNIACEQISANGELTENTGESATWVTIGEGETANCKLGAIAATVTDFTAELHWLPSSEHLLEITFEVDLPGITCHFEGLMPFSYEVGSDVVSINEGSMEASPGVCGPGTLSGDFTLSQTGGGSVVLD